MAEVESKFAVVEEPQETTQKTGCRQQTKCPYIESSSWSPTQEILMGHVSFY